MNDKIAVGEVITCRMFIDFSLLWDPWKLVLI
jgi:hypothetical protein